MNTLFNTSFDDDPRPHDLPGVRLRANSYELQETNVRLKLTIVDTVGFGDQINKDNSFKVCLRTFVNKSTVSLENCHLKFVILKTFKFDYFQPIVDYIDQQFEAYLQEELKVKRNLYSYSDRCVN